MPRKPRGGTVGRPRISEEPLEKRSVALRRDQWADLEAGGGSVSATLRYRLDMLREIFPTREKPSTEGGG